MTPKSVFSFFILLGLLWSCTTEIKPIIFETTEVKSSFEADISVTYNQAIGNNELSKTINFKIEEGIISTLSDASKKTNLDSILKDFNTEYINFKAEFPDASESVWELFIETEKIYQSQDIITIAISTYEFKGGAHGNDKIKLLNINAKSGEILTKSDIIEDLDAFKKLAKTYFLKSQETNDNTSLIEDYFYGKPFQLPENLGFSDDGFILLYNTYEIASFEKGFTEFAIPFEEVVNYLKVQ